MRFDAIGPQLRAGFRVNRVDVAFDVAEVGQKAMSTASLANRRRRTDAGVSTERPVDAAARGIERIDKSGVGAHEDAMAHNGRLAVGGIAVWKSERPLERQLWRVRRRELRRRLVPRVLDVDSPPV